MFVFLKLDYCGDCAAWARVATHTTHRRPSTTLSNVLLAAHSALSNVDAAVRLLVILLLLAVVDWSVLLPFFGALWSRVV